jgi:predicted DNA-binding transcriptional regulator AlpA
MEKKLTHDTLPQGVAILLKEFREFKNLFIQKQENTPTEQPEKWLDLNELIQYDPEKRTKPTWYSKISRNEVPYYKRGKKVYFLKSEIDVWLKQGKCKSNTEIEQESEAYLLNAKKALK